MVSTFISPVISKGAELGLSLYEDIEPVELHPNDSPSTRETIILAVYRQVLGNAYVMESERLTIPESKLKEGKIGVREFVRQVAQSKLYQSRFFDNCPRYRSIELNFKHLLGRAPDSYEETSLHSQILDRGGYIAEINSYIDSEEYQNKFGDNIVPYYCGYKTQAGKNIVGFTHLFQLFRGASCSDKKLTTQDKPRLTSSLVNNSPSPVILPSSSESYGGVTDINKLLAKVFDSKTQAVSSTPQFASQSSSSSTTADYEASSSSVNSAQKIAELQQKLSNLSSFANIGAAKIGRWQQSSATSETNAVLASPDSASPQQIIADLERKIADAQRLANIGEARLNKWRKRSFR
ncbi:MAG: phycobilisome rod-core linker polypeptide [Cyanobacteria bacterium P01_C01_bin.72]